MPSHQALWVILEVVRNCFTVSPHGSLHGDLIHCLDGMFLLAARLNFHLFHFPRAQSAACTGTWLSSLCLFMFNLFPVIFKVSFSYLLIFIFFFCMKILWLQMNWGVTCCHTGFGWEHTKMRELSSFVALLYCNLCLIYRSFYSHFPCGVIASLISFSLWRSCWEWWCWSYLAISTAQGCDVLTCILCVIKTSSCCAFMVY